jgi:Ca2+-binding EF-hand superfamily protein
MKFLDLTNYANYEKKIKYTFKFFDLSKTGRIKKDDFCKVIFELCQYFSSISTTRGNNVFFFIKIFQ